MTAMVGFGTYVMFILAEEMSVHSRGTIQWYISVVCSFQISSTWWLRRYNSRSNGTSCLQLFHLQIPAAQIPCCNQLPLVTWTKLTANQIDHMWIWCGIYAGRVS